MSINISDLVESINEDTQKPDEAIDLSEIAVGTNDREVSKLASSLAKIASERGQYYTIECPALAKKLVINATNAIPKPGAKDLTNLFLKLTILYRTCPHYEDQALDIAVSEYFKKSIDSVSQNGMQWRDFLQYSEWLLAWEQILLSRNNAPMNSVVKENLGVAWSALADTFKQANDVVSSAAYIATHDFAAAYNPEDVGSQNWYNQRMDLVSKVFPITYEDDLRQTLQDSESPQDTYWPELAVEFARLQWLGTAARQYASQLTAYNLFPSSFSKKPVKSNDTIIENIWTKIIKKEADFAEDDMVQLWQTGNIELLNLCLDPMGNEQRNNLVDVLQKKSSESEKVPLDSKVWLYSYLSADALDEKINSFMDSSLSEQTALLKYLIEKNDTSRFTKLWVSSADNLPQRNAIRNILSADNFNQIRNARGDILGTIILRVYLLGDDCADEKTTPEYIRLIKLGDMNVTRAILNLLDDIDNDKLDMIICHTSPSQRDIIKAILAEDDYSLLHKVSKDAVGWIIINFYPDFEKTGNVLNSAANRAKVAAEDGKFVQSTIQVACSALSWLLREVDFNRSENLVTRDDFKCAQWKGKRNTKVKDFFNAFDPTNEQHMRFLENLFSDDNMSLLKKLSIQNSADLNDKVHFLVKYVFTSNEQRRELLFLDDPQLSYQVFACVISDNFDEDAADELWKLLEKKSGAHRSVNKLFQSHGADLMTQLANQGTAQSIAAATWAIRNIYTCSGEKTDSLYHITQPQIVGELFKQNVIALLGWITENKKTKDEFEPYFIIAAKDPDVFELIKKQLMSTVRTRNNTPIKVILGIQSKNPELGKWFFEVFYSEIKDKERLWDENGSTLRCMLLQHGAQTWLSSGCWNEGITLSRLKQITDLDSTFVSTLLQLIRYNIPKINAGIARYFSETHNIVVQLYQRKNSPDDIKKMLSVVLMNKTFSEIITFIINAVNAAYYVDERYGICKLLAEVVEGLPDTSFGEHSALATIIRSEIEYRRICKDNRCRPSWTNLGGREDGKAYYDSDLKCIEELQDELVEIFNSKKEVTNIFELRSDSQLSILKFRPCNWSSTASSKKTPLEKLAALEKTKSFGFC